ncbi:hypothetical protein ACFL40_04110 [candidate division KSB1 bacterium]
MKKIIITVVLTSLVFMVGCSMEKEEEVKHPSLAERNDRMKDVIKQRIVNNNRYNESQKITPEFRSDIFYRGKEIEKWRKEAIDESLSKIIKTEEGIFIPEQTKNIDIRPPGNEIVFYSNGIGRVLSGLEKKKLPENILSEIKSYYELRKQFIDLDYYDYVVIAFAERYNTYDPFKYNKYNKPGTIFLAILGSKQEPFKKLKNIEDLGSELFYINFSPFSIDYVLFYRDSNGIYKILKKSGAG